jgi:hypothetical protein
VLVFNGSRTIDETSIQTLGFIARITTRIKTTSAAGAGAGAGSTDSARLHEFFPSFVWVLRDFSLLLRNEVRQAVLTISLSLSL